jgi:subtilisin family serine protease
LTAPIVAIAALRAGAAPADGGGALRPAAETRIDESLLSARADDTQDFLVVLGERPDLSAARGAATKAEKGRLVRERLVETARRSQRELAAWLAARGIAHESFWIANMIRVRGPRSVIDEIARRPEVSRVAANRSARRREKPRVEEAVPGRLASAALAAASVPGNLVLVGAPEVWAAGITGQGIVIGGADTGIEWDHPALKPRYRGWNGSAASHAYNWHDAVHDAGAGNVCGSNSAAPCDDDGHGTQTIGVAVGDDGGDNRVGMAPGARWIGCRNMDEGFGTPARYAECFQWFLAPTDAAGANPRPDLAPDVITNSWDCPTQEGCTTPDILKTVVQNVRAAGILVGVSAGNEGPTCGTIVVPGIYSELLTVGAVDEFDDVTGYSSRGPGQGVVKPDVAAPGENVISSQRGGGYGIIDGTSASTPHVAGLAALILSANPGLAGDVDALEAIIRGTAVAKTSAETCGGLPAGALPNNASGHGRIDAAAAWGAARCPDPPAIEVPSSVPPGTSGLSAGVPPSPAHQYTWQLQGGTLTSGQGQSDIVFTSGAAGTTLQLSVVDAVGGCSSAAGVARVLADFTDVPPSHLFHNPIVDVALAGISTGCGAGNFCPSDAVTRAQMAVFILRAVHGAAYKPPAASGTLFSDVPPGTFLGDWIERFAVEGFTTGCGGGKFCPEEALNRAAAAVFLLRGKHGTSYTPPAASGTVFDDVPPGAFLGSWIEQLAAEGITGGCGGGNFCPGSPVTRGEMSAFLRRAFPSIAAP